MNIWNNSITVKAPDGGYEAGRALNGAIGFHARHKCLVNNN